MRSTGVTRGLLRGLYLSAVIMVGVLSILATRPTPTPTPTPAEPTDWPFVGSNPISEGEVVSQISLTRLPGLHVAYAEKQTDSRVVVKGFSPSANAWTAKPEIGVRALSLDFGYMGDITIGVADLDNNGMASVYKYDYQTQQWARIGQSGISPGYVPEIDLVQHSSDTLRHAVIVNSMVLGQGGTTYPYAFTYRQSANWTDVGGNLQQLGDTYPYSFAGSIGSGRLHIGFGDATDGPNRGGLTMLSGYFPSATVGGWDVERKISQGGVGSISMRSNYVAYRDQGLGGKIVVREYTGSGTTPGDWVVLGQEGFSEGGANHIAITLGIDKSGGGSTHPTRPYVVFSDEAKGGRSTVMKWNGSQWVTIGTPGFSAAEAQNHAISFNNDQQTIYVAYKDMDRGGKLVIKQHANE